MNIELTPDTNQVTIQTDELKWILSFEEAIEVSRLLNHVLKRGKPGATNTLSAGPFIRREDAPTFNVPQLSEPMINPHSGEE